MGYWIVCMLFICILYYIGFDSLVLLNYVYEDVMIFGFKML